MRTVRSWTGIAALLVAAGCAAAPRAQRVDAEELNCMARAMYFESHRSSREGMIAVGTVVMNRVDSTEFPATVCGVVGQRNQFAPGVMSRDMNSRSLPLALEAAGAVLQGERHPQVETARFFHAASYRAGYNNMHYVATAGGNAFYEKRPPAMVTQPVPLPPSGG
ncbi:cell wall hydrolase [Salipiger sp. P9]|uniref:cell wall hydrolase n=1 Tax=Salipiger pentaromativorans TaxID=2943193 RepID=UPI0021586913|nr:cell wall hydrolase [Salipiger pentaromativorans]MCR8550762.1 cell wall hydrolase [Salipiger pentaromativorans]